MVYIGATIVSVGSEADSVAARIYGDVYRDGSPGVPVTRAWECSIGSRATIYAYSTSSVGS